MKTYSAKPGAVKGDWYLVDASGKTLGRLASELATRLRGKHKPEYTPHVDTGDFLVVINATSCWPRPTTATAASPASSRPSRCATSCNSTRSARWRLRSRACCRRIRWAARCSRN
jgi:hypothetical protein